MASLFMNTIFQFVLVFTHNTKDVVFVNTDVEGQKFTIGDVTCEANIKYDKDPVQTSQGMGSLVLSCKHGNLPIKTSVICTETDPAAHNHFEIGEGDQKYSFDLLCKARPQNPDDEP
jgi:hypothetical protein